MAEDQTPTRAHARRLHLARHPGPSTWVFLAGVAVHELAPPAREAWAELAPRLPDAGPLVLLAAGVLFGIGFHHLRLGGLALLGAGLLWTVDRVPLPAPQPVGAVAEPALPALFLPALFFALNLAWIGLWPPRARLDARLFGALALVAAQAATFPFWAPAAGELLGRLLEVETVPESVLAALPFLGLSTWGARALLRRASLPAAALWIAVGVAIVLATPVGAPADPGRGELFRWLVAIVALLALAEASYRLAYTDELTGLPARRSLVDTLARLRGEYALAVVDVDHFKRFNDRHGHDVGDQVLRRVAADLRTVAGAEAFRLGGEEFALVFPRGSAEDAETALEAVRRRVAARRFVVRAKGRPRRKPAAGSAKSSGGQKRKVTVSIGLAGPRPRDASPTAVLERADQALYRAKRAGRNRLVAAKGR